MNKDGEEKDGDGGKEVANSVIRSKVGTSDHHNRGGAPSMERTGNYHKQKARRVSVFDVCEKQAGSSRSLICIWYML